jgi:hypothetical protein
VSDAPALVPIAKLELQKNRWRIVLARMRYFLLIPPLIVLSFAGCSSPVRSGPLIDSFNRAECILVTLGPKTGSPARTWDYLLKTLQTGRALITGRQIPGGRIDVKYEATGADEVAADAGDYIYPDDVRFNGDRLYIKASGVPVIGAYQTWVFDYDLRHHRQIARLRVDPNVLTKECPLRISE